MPDTEVLTPAEELESPVADEVTADPESDAAATTNETAEERADRLQAELDATKKRRKAGEDGAVNRERIAREKAEADLAAIRDELVAVRRERETVNAQQAMQASQAQLGQRVAQEVAKERTRLEAEGYADSTIERYLVDYANTRREQGEARFDREETKMGFLAGARDKRVGELLAEAAKEAADDGLSPNLDLNAALKSLSLYKDKPWAGPNNDGHAAAVEVEREIPRYINKVLREARAAAKAGTTDAGRKANAAARAADSPETQADGNNGALSGMEIFTLIQDGKLSAHDAMQRPEYVKKLQAAGLF